jgi:hypothetical protein
MIGVDCDGVYLWEVWEKNNKRGSFAGSDSMS